MLGSDAVHTRWEIRKLIAVTIACAGVSAVVYGGAKSSSKPDAQTQDAGIEGIDLRSLAFLGDGLALAASIIAGLNTVYYSRFAVPAFETDRHLSPTSSSTLYEGEYESLPMKAEEDADARDGEPTASCTLAPFDLPPFALYPNFILSLIGSTTFLLLWIPIPIMRWMSIGPTFELPPDAKTWASLSLVAIAGVVSNAGYMVSYVAFSPRAFTHPDEKPKKPVGPVGDMGPSRRLSGRHVDHRPHCDERCRVWQWDECGDGLELDGWRNDYRRVLCVGDGRDACEQLKILSVCSLLHLVLPNWHLCRAIVHLLMFVYHGYGKIHAVSSTLNSASSFRSQRYGSWNQSQASLSERRLRKSQWKTLTQGF